MVIVGWKFSPGWDCIEDLSARGGGGPQEICSAGEFSAGETFH